MSWLAEAGEVLAEAGEVLPEVFGDGAQVASKQHDNADNHAGSANDLYEHLLFSFLVTGCCVVCRVHSRVLLTAPNRIPLGWKRCR